MARVTCRCGETIEVAGPAPERIVCPRCQTRIRIRRPKDQPAPAADDGYIRFACPCGRRLKVRATSRLEAGKCPDCGRIVPIPEPSRTAGAGSGAGVGGSYQGAGPDPETRTEELDKADVARLGRWAARHGVSPEAARPSLRPRPPEAAEVPPELADTPAQTPAPAPPPARREAGLRVCPQCRKPLHMSATVCRSCGASTPKG